MADTGRQLKKGVLETVVMKMLTNKNMYGYEIIQELDRESSGTFSLKEGTLYPVLYRLEDENFISSYWEEGTGKRGVPRKYYSLTEAGRQALERAVEEWTMFSAIVNKILRGDE